MYFTVYWQKMANTHHNTVQHLKLTYFLNGSSTWMIDFVVFWAQWVLFSAVEKKQRVSPTREVNEFLAQWASAGNNY